MLYNIVYNEICINILNDLLTKGLQTKTIKKKNRKTVMAVNKKKNGKQNKW